MSAQSKSYSNGKATKSASVAATGNEKKHASERGSRMETPTNSSPNKKMKKDALPSHPEMTAPELMTEEPERSISPVVEELTKIKERVFEV